MIYSHKKGIKLKSQCIKCGLFIYKQVYVLYQMFTVLTVLTTVWRWFSANCANLQNLAEKKYERYQTRCTRWKASRRLDVFLLGCGLFSCNLGGTGTWHWSRCCGSGSIAVVTWAELYGTLFQMSSTSCVECGARKCWRQASLKVCLTIHRILYCSTMKLVRTFFYSLVCCAFFFGRCRAFVAFKRVCCWKKEKIN